MADNSPNYQEELLNCMNDYLKSVLNCSNVKFFLPLLSRSSIFQKPVLPSCLRLCLSASSSESLGSSRRWSSEEELQQRTRMRAGSSFVSPHLTASKDIIMYSTESNINGRLFIPTNQYYFLLCGKTRNT